MTVTEDARDFLREQIKTEYTLMDIGESGGSTDITNDALDSSITDAIASPSAGTKLACTITTSLNNQVEFAATVDGSLYAGYTIREVGLFNATSTVMLTRIPIDPIGPLVNTKTYDIKIIMEVE